ncbi:hypothetical protein [Sphingomonas oligoaromativorans]|uniref:hypothetical protein n=1 Tax=Sphingomonas oligoaromativorans TaxID=575322 RepID=UPI001420F4B6|nr:hypothetical protein [Sphingomonas oligoaromativorans]NIJ32794.1 hypothetical protein [Sphingomonas oligoaromativorans]
MLNEKRQAVTDEIAKNGNARTTAKRGPTGAERGAIARADKEVSAKRWRFQVDYDPERSTVLSQHEDETGWAMASAAAFGTTSGAFVDGSMGDLASVVKGRKDQPTEVEFNAALALVDGAEPANEVEAALLIQMASTHSLTMRCMAMAAASPGVAIDGGMGNLSVKLLRTFTAQIEALTKLRRGGEQVVRHIHVDNRGGQAVIAETVHTGACQNAKIADQSQGQYAGGPFGSAMPREDATWHGVPVPSPEREEEVQIARRPGRRTKRQ